MASGTLKSLTFTPAHSGVLKLSISCEGQGTSGGDWGGSIAFKAFATQSSVTTYGEAIPVSSTSRLPQSVQESFDVVAGASVECGLYGYISGAVALSAWNVKIIAKLYKR